MFGRYGLMTTYIIDSGTRVTLVAPNRYSTDKQYGYTYRRTDGNRATFVVHMELDGSASDQDNESLPDDDMYWELYFTSSSGGSQSNGEAREYRRGILINTAGVWSGAMTYLPVP
jgi:hypothetical protein